MRIELPQEVRDRLSNLDDLSVEAKAAIADILDTYLDYRKTNKFYYYDPDPPMKKFFDLGLHEELRGLIAANRCGKSYSGTFEVACHATGIYPTVETHGWDWDGIRYALPTTGWILGETMESICSPGNLRDLLLGPLDNWGTGWIPADLIEDIHFNNEGKGLVKTILVKHASGGTSTIGVRFYSQGMGPLMGASLDYFLIDESPRDDSIFPQMITRIQKGQNKSGRGLVTATPERGKQPLIKEFFDEDGQYHKGFVGCTVWDVAHITELDIDKMKRMYPKHQWDMRMKGMPILGSGAVYPVEQELIEYSDIEIENHWKVVTAVDFGFSTEAAVVSVAYDPDTTTFYVFRAHKESEWLIPMMATYINAIGHYAPVIWPSDGANSTQGAGGIGLKDQLGAQGCNVHYEQFFNPADPMTGRRNNHVETGLSFIRTLMKSGKLKVHRSLVEFWGEYRNYQYSEKDGKVRKVDDHLMDAFRYATMSVMEHGISKNDEVDNSDTSWNTYIED